MFFLRGKEGSAHLGRFSFSRENLHRSGKMCRGTIVTLREGINEEDRSKVGTRENSGRKKCGHNESDNYSDKIEKSSDTVQ